MQLLQEFVERLHDFLCDFQKLRKHKTWNLVSTVDKIWFCFLLCEHKSKSIILILVDQDFLDNGWRPRTKSTILYLIRKCILYERYFNWIIFLAIIVRFIKRKTCKFTRGQYMKWLLAIKLKLIYQNRESLKWDDNLIVKIYHKAALSLFNCTAIQELVNL